MSHILLITSSPRGTESLSSRFATEIAEGIKSRTNATLTIRDLVTTSTPHINENYIYGRVMPAETRSPEQAEAVQIAQIFVDELLAADIIVIGSGMMNFGPSSQLKAWIDHVTWPSVTFSYGNGQPQGLLTGKKVYLVTAAGGVFSEGETTAFDFQTNYLIHLLGFIGLTDVELVRIEGTVMGPDMAKAASDNAHTVVQSLLAQV